MLSLTIVVLVTVAAGFIVWANDKRHAKYGMGLPAGVAAAVGALELDHLHCRGLRLPAGPDLDSVGPAHGAGDRGCSGAAVYLGRTRAHHDTLRLTSALKL